MNQKRFVVLDRDGTINVEREYLSQPDQLELLPGAANGLRHLRKLGLGLVVITNQSGIGRGFFDLPRLDLIHQRLHALLAAEDIQLDDIYVCPHRPNDGCRCRKPQLELLLKAAQEHHFNPSEAFVIGDNTVDIELGRQVGATTLLVLTGYGAQVAEQIEANWDYAVDDLESAAVVIEHLLMDTGNRTTTVESTHDLLQDRVLTHLQESADLKHKVAQLCLPSILMATDFIVEAFQEGGKMLLCGNGGSAADCQHLAAEFMSRSTKELERPGLPAIALTTDTSFLTAFANDRGFDGIFERQVRALGKPGDVLIGISTSGNSENVLRAVNTAHEIGIKTIGLMGKGGILETKVDCAIALPSRNTQYIQEALLSIEHLLCDLTEQILFARGE